MTWAFWESNEERARADRWPAVLLGTLLLAAVAAVGWTQQAPPVPDDPATDEFQVDRAMDLLSRLADAPHAIGQPNHGRARDFVIDEFQSIGYEVTVQSATTAGRPATHNLLARLDGTGGDTADTILVAAHFDSVADAPGAADDGVGTVAVVESARALRAGPTMVNDVIFLVTDGEEQGLWGAWAFVEEHAWADEVDFVLNFESGGPRGPVNVLEIDLATTSMVRTLATETPRPLATSLIDDLVAAAREGGVGSSDFVPFRTLGNPGFNLANSRDTGFRHTPGDTFDRIDPSTVQHQGETLIGLVRAYGDVDLGEVGGDGKVVWVTLVTGLTLTWSGTIAWVLLALVLALAIALVVALRRRGLRPGSVARSFGVGFGAMGISIAAAMLLVGIVQLVRPGIRPHVNGILPRLEFPGAGVPGGELYFFGIIGLTVFAAIWLLHRTRRKVTVHELVIGTTLLFVLLAALSTWGLTGASYLFTLPLLFLLPTNLWWLTRMEATSSGWAAAAVVAVGALPTVLVGASLGVYFETFTLANTIIVAPLVALFVVQLVPAFEVIARGHPTLPGLGTGGVGLVMLVVALATIAPEPVLASDEWTGDPGRTEVSRTALAPPTTSGASPLAWAAAAVTYDDGGVCVEATGAIAPLAWCPLPADVSVPVDVQLIRRDDRVLLVGNIVHPTADRLVVVHGDVRVEVPLRELAGVPGRAFLTELGVEPAIVGGFEILDASGAVVAVRHGLELPDADTSLRGFHDHAPILGRDDN